MIKRLLLFTLLLTTFFLVGCGCERIECVGSTHEFVKDVEGKAYDSVSGAVSKYCEGKTTGGIIGGIAQQEALELRREIRQRGNTGPQGPLEKPEFLDDKTAYGLGPVVRIWCDGDPVPENIWWDFVRIRP